MANAGFGALAIGATSETGNYNTVLKKTEFCRLRDVFFIDGFIGHDCDTWGGSSGSPLFKCSGSKCTIIGLNNSGHRTIGKEYIPMLNGNYAINPSKFYNIVQCARAGKDLTKTECTKSTSSGNILNQGITYISTFIEKVKGTVGTITETVSNAVEQLVDKVKDTVSNIGKIIGQFFR